MNKFTIFILLVFSTLTLKAQENKELSNLIKGILQYSPSLKSQKNLLAIGDLKTQIQESYGKPTVGAEIGIVRMDPVSKASFASPTGTSVLQFQPNMNYNSQFVASHTIYDWGKNALAVEKTRLESNLTKAQIEQQEFNLGFQIAQLYYQIQYLYKVLDVQKSQLNRFESQFSIIANQVKLGAALEYDQISQQVRVQNQQIKIVEVDSQIKLITDYLSTLLGQNAAPYLHNNQSFLKGNSTNNELSINDNIEIEQLSAQEAISKKEIELAQSSNLPSISGIASLGIRNGFVPRINGETPDFADDFKLNSMLGIKLNIPIYSGKRGAKQTSIAKIQQERIQLQLQDTQEKLSNSFSQAKTVLSTNSQKYESQKKVVEQSKYALKLAENKFKEGFIRKIELDQVQNTVEEAELIATQYEYLMKINQLEILKIQGIKIW
ncbi:TolC family protein [Aquirufa sp. ROCK2-A2]